MKCPKCDGPVELRWGPCVVISRRQDTGKTDADGDVIAYVPIAHAEIRECVNLTGCDWARAGLDLGAGWMLDEDLVPLSVVQAKHMEYREEKEHRRRPRPEPGS